jgi:hypothetical protein
MVSGLSSPVSGQAGLLTEREAVDTLLAAASIPSVFNGMADAVLTQIRVMGPELGPGSADRVRASVAQHFAPGRLFEAAANSLLRADGATPLQEVAGWLTVGPVAEARRTADAYRPPSSIEAFAAAVTDRPPPQDRVQLILRLARAQGAGPFYVVLSETLRGSAHMALRAVDPARPPFVGVSDAGADEWVRTQDQQAAFILLYRYQAVSSELLERVVERYESAAGQWYIDALSDAVTEAILGAAERVAAEVGGLRGPLGGHP